jgi:hypothetical protein
MLENELSFHDLIVTAIAGRLDINKDFVKLAKTRFLPEEGRAVREVTVAGRPTGVLYDMGVPVNENREINIDELVANENRKLDEMVAELKERGYSSAKWR